MPGSGGICAGALAACRNIGTQRPLSSVRKPPRALHTFASVRMSRARKSSGWLRSGSVPEGPAGSPGLWSGKPRSHSDRREDGHSEKTSFKLFIANYLSMRPAFPGFGRSASATDATIVKAVKKKSPDGGLFFGFSYPAPLRSIELLSKRTAGRPTRFPQKTSERPGVWNFSCFPDLPFVIKRRHP